MNQARWPRIRLKYTCEVNPPAPRVAEDQEVTFVPMEAVGERGGISTDATRPGGAVRQAYTGFRDGDVVVAKITPCFENGKGAIIEGMLDGVGFGTTELHVLRARDSDPLWLFYVTQSKHFMGLGEGSMYGAGGQKRVPPDFIRNYEAWTPPLPTQKAIAAFLDRKTAAIDALIEKKQKLLELLAEKRAALINQAVTKGLDPTVPMKDSGIPWIGEIPAHWEVKRLKFLADVRGGVTKGQKHDGHETTMLPYLRVANVQDGHLDLAEVHEIEVRLADVNRYRLQPGDILMNEGGDNDKLGRGAVWEGAIEPCLHQNHVFAVRPVAGVDPYWVNLTTQAAYLKHFFYRRANQSTNLASISASNLKEAPIIWPPLAERRRIKAWLARLLSAVGVTIGRSGEQVERLQEYRQALITAAVTGQLDITQENAA